MAVTGTYAPLNTVALVEELTNFRNEIDVLYGETCPATGELVEGSPEYQQFIARLHEAKSVFDLDIIYAALNWSPHLRDRRFEIIRDYVILDTASVFTSPMAMRLFQRIFSLRPDIVGITDKEKGKSTLSPLRVHEELDLLNCFDIQYADLKEFIGLFPGTRSVILPFQTLQFSDPSRSIGKKIAQFSQDNPNIKKLTLSGNTILNEFCIGKLIQIPELLTRVGIPVPNAIHMGLENAGMEFDDPEFWEIIYRVDAQTISQSRIALSSIRAASFNFGISEGDTWIDKDCDSYINYTDRFPDFLMNKHTGITSMVFNNYNGRSGFAIFGDTLAELILRNQWTLQTIDLSALDFRGDFRGGNISILNALVQCKDLTGLMLGACFRSAHDDLDQKEAIVNALVGVVEKCTKLESLDLSGWFFFSNETLINGLINHGKSLTSLNLEGNRDSFETVNRLAAGCPNLTWINCSNGHKWTDQEKAQLERDYPKITFVWKSIYH